MKLKTIRKLDVIYSAPNKNTSFRSIEEVMKHMDRAEKRLNELDEELKPLLDVKLVPVNASRPTTIDFTLNTEDSKRKVTKSEDVVKVQISKKDKKAMDNGYQKIAEYQKIQRNMDGFLTVIEGERTDRLYQKAKERGQKILNHAKGSAENAEKVLEKIANGYIDAHFKKFMNSTIRKVRGYFRGSYDKSTVKLFPSYTENDLEIKCYLIFGHIYDTRHKEMEDYCIRFSLVLGGDDHRTYWVKVMDEGFRLPVPGEGLGAEVKDPNAAFRYIITRMALDGIQEQGYFPPDIDFKRADWGDVANLMEFDEELRWIRFRLKPGMTNRQQHEAAKRLKEIIIRKILDMDYHDVHDVMYQIYQEKASNGKTLTLVEFTSDLKNMFKFSYVAIENITKMVPHALNSRQKVAIQKAIQRISMEPDY